MNRSDLDDLRENFSIEDVLDVYNNGLLVKWLDVRNYKSELEKVKAIQATDARGILTALIQIFGVSSDPSEIEESLSVLDYLEGRKKFWDDIKAGKFDEIARNISRPQNEEVHEEETHHTIKKSYYELVQEIIDNHQDLSHIYDCLDAITAGYPELLKEKYSELFNSLYNNVPHVCYALLGHHGTRVYYLLNNNELEIAPKKEHESHDLYRYPPAKGYQYTYTFVSGISGPQEWRIIYPTKDIDETKISSAVREKLCFANMLYKISDSMFLVQKGFGFGPIYEISNIKHPYLKVSAKIKSDRKDSNEWHVIEPSGKKFMIFYTGAMPLFAKDVVAGTYTHHLSYLLQDASLTFPVFDGLDVKTTEGSENYYCNAFCYMEAR